LRLDLSDKESLPVRRSSINGRVGKYLSLPEARADSSKRLARMGNGAGPSKGSGPVKSRQARNSIVVATREAKKQFGQAHHRKGSTSRSSSLPSARLRAAALAELPTYPEFESPLKAGSVSTSDSKVYA
jgi:hypothetical protein